MPGATAKEPAPYSPPRPAGRLWTRDELVRLGQSGKPWEFLPIAIQALGVEPRDEGLRFLAAANFARLGLVTPAAEMLAELSCSGAANPDVQSLSGLVGSLPSDRLDPAEMTETCRNNTEALLARGTDLRSAFAGWTERTRGTTWIRALDGNVVRRAGGASRVGWGLLGDHLGAADRFRRSYQPGTNGKRIGELAVEGVDPPWLLQRLAAALTRDHDGYQPRLRVVQSDALELLDGFALANLREIIEDPRVRFFIGPEAGAALGEDLRAKSETRVGGSYILLPSARGRVKPPVAVILQEAEAEDRKECERLTAEVEQVYAGRDAGWWRRRYDAASAAGGTPLRVLIPTCRHSSFIKHSSADLASALRGVGCDVEVLVEGDDHGVLSPLAYLRRFCHFQPDLVVMINYSRSDMGGMIPRNIPFVCWVQDAMPHLFGKAAGSKPTELDFVIGHLYRELFDGPGFLRERAMRTPVLASAAKFHAGPVSGAARSRFACDIAYVGNQSETAEAFRDRMMRDAAEAAPSGVTPDLLARLYEGAIAVVADPSVVAVADRLRDAARESWAGVHAYPASDAQLTVLVNTLLSPMADRAVRHQTLRWAAAIAERHNLRFHLHGRGWDQHPDLARFARGPVAHGEDLRACYQSAGMHLHASVNSVYHQRVWECFLSGGVTLLRLRAEDIWPMHMHTLATLAESGTPTYTRLCDRTVIYRTGDNAPAMNLAALRQRLGLEATSSLGLLPEHAAQPWAFNGGGPIARDAAWVFGDISEIAFRSESTLEERVLCCLGSARWRRNVAEGVRRRVREHYSYESLAPRLISLVSSRLASRHGSDPKASSHTPDNLHAGITFVR